jgi:dinuclear metal center YbgI/SA1388 family protein
MKTGDILKHLDKVIPAALQEKYDNSGLQTGSYATETSSALLSVDVNEEVLEEAVASGCSLVISHHPLIFSPLRKIDDTTAVGRTVMAAVRNGITIWSAHTNLDSVYGGVSFKMAEKLGLKDLQVLSPQKEKLVKLVTFVPGDWLDRVREAVFAAGAGNIGNYDYCGFHASGEGSFRGNDLSNPFTGNKGEIHAEPEVRFETIMPSFLTAGVVRALIAAHPYEEPAYDLYPLLNEWDRAGLGCIGAFENSVTETEFLDLCKKVFSPVCLRHTSLTGSLITKVAMCGGAGASLIDSAISSGAGAFITGDLKYHQFAEAAGEILLVDSGHDETEKFSLEIIYDLIIKKFPNFALRFSKTVTNPIKLY